jgi:hypothetical protein
MENKTNANPVNRDRVIRVFVSSTFRDMFAEREELVKQIFPQLRKLCDQRGVVWGEVDLRWGVTEGGRKGSPDMFSGNPALPPIFYRVIRRTLWLDT